MSGKIAPAFQVSDLGVSVPGRQLVTSLGFDAKSGEIIAILGRNGSGKTLTLHGRDLNVYAQAPVSGTVDDAILAYELETGIPAPGGDLLFSDPYSVLSEGVESSSYIGTAYIDGVECHHLAFREDKVDWQIWVRTGEEPVPIKYVITSKWQTAAPQYELRIRDWNINPKLDADRFSFSPPEGAVELKQMVLNELGEFAVEAGGQ